MSTMVGSFHFSLQQGDKSQTADDLPAAGSKSATLLQQHIDKLSGSLEGYQIADLVGAAIFNKQTVYNKPGYEDHNQSTLSNEFKKSDLDFGPMPVVLQAFQKYVGNNAASVWISNTFSVDMNLAVTKPPDHPVTQAFFISVEFPVVLLTLYEKGDATNVDNTENSARAESAQCFAVEVAKRLTRRLLHFCHEDFLILACTVSWDDLDTLKCEIKKRKDNSHHFYDGPRQLTKGTYAQLRKAALALSQTSPVPAFYPALKDEESLFVLERDCFDVVSLMVETFVHCETPCHVTYTSTAALKFKVALIEAVRRLSFTYDVWIYADDAKFRGRIDHMKKLSRTDDSVEIRLNSGPLDQSNEGTRPRGIHVSVDYVEEIDSGAVSSGEGRKRFKFLTVGATSSGKSTTANTIFGKIVFEAQCDRRPATSKFQHRSHSRGKIDIEIMERPDQPYLDAELKESLDVLHPGPHAFLFVTALDKQFDEKDYMVYNRLRAFDNNITRFMIVVFTYGDILEKDKCSFDEFLKSAPSLQEMLQRCDNRYVIFNNKALNPAPEVDSLLDIVKQMMKRDSGRPYSCPAVEETLPDKGAP